MAGGRDLTPRQREKLDWVKDFIRKHGMPPTVREIGAAFGIKSSTVFEILATLQRKGYLRRGDLGARSLIVEGMERTPRGMIEVRVVGRIAAGRPIEAVEDDRDTVAIVKELIRGRKAFALKVAGDSMVEAGILDGDYVVVRQQETADNGDIVVAIIGEEATLKRFHRVRDGVRLEPANREMTPITVRSGDFRIQGKVVAVHRTLEAGEHS